MSLHKSLYPLALILLSIPYVNILADQINGPMTQEIEDEFGNIERYTVYYASESKDYVEGGVTFTYPTGLFSAPPVVRLGIESLDPLSTNETVTAYVSSNSATTTTVDANFLDTTLGVVSIAEATSGTVKIHLFAIAP